MLHELCSKESPTGSNQDPIPIITAIPFSPNTKVSEIFFVSAAYNCLETHTKIILQLTPPRCDTPLTASFFQNSKQHERFVSMVQDQMCKERVLHWSSGKGRCVPNRRFGIVSVFEQFNFQNLVFRVRLLILDILAKQTTNMETVKQYGNWVILNKKCEFADTSALNLSTVI